MSFPRRSLPGLAAGLLAAPALAQRADARTLRFVPSGDLFSLDSLWASAAVAGIASYLVYDMLYSPDAAMVPRPQMVGREDENPERTRLTLTLRDGLRFSDGEPVRAADCVASIRRFMQRNSVGLRMAAVIDDLSALDDTRLEFRLKRPFPQLRYGLANCFVLPERLAKTSAFTEVKEMIGSGPFTFLAEERVIGHSAAFRRNPGYTARQEAPSGFAGGRPLHLERVEFRTLPDPASAAAALQRGEVDYLYQPAFDLIPRLRRQRDIRIETPNRHGWLSLLNLNCAAPPFDNPALRRAVLAAVNQDDFMEAAVGREAGIPWGQAGCFATASPIETMAGRETLPPRNPEALRRLVREAGYTGQKVVLMMASDSPVHSLFGPVAEQMLKGIGLNVELQSMDFGSVMQRFRSREATSAGHWSCFTVNWTGYTTVSPAGHTLLVGNEKDARMPALVDAWYDAPDLPAQKQAGEAISRHFYQEPPFAPLGALPAPIAVRANVQGVLESGVPVFWNIRKD